MLNTEEIYKKLDQLKEKNRLRSLREVSSPNERFIVLNGKKVLNMCSNNYLGLANHPVLKEAARAALEKYGTGAGSSRLISGNNELNTQLEEAIAKWQETEACLLFSSGYLANVGVIPALTDRESEIFADKHIHASMIDGCLISRARLTRYPHCDMDVLEKQLKKSSAKNKLIVTESVFSMDGDLAPLPEIHSLAVRYGAMIYLDEAHAIGLGGDDGSGCWLAADLPQEESIRIGTLGKAIGSYGAFVACSKKMREYLLNHARSFFFNTGLPAPVLAASLAAVKMMPELGPVRDSLWEKIIYLHHHLRRINVNMMDSASAIIPIVIGDDKETMRITQELLDRGIYMQGIRPPTVPEGTARLRSTCMAQHTIEDMDLVLNALDEIINKK